MNIGPFCVICSMWELRGSAASQVCTNPASLISRHLEAQCRSDYTENFSKQVFVFTFWLVLFRKGAWENFFWFAAKLFPSFMLFVCWEQEFSGLNGPSSIETNIKHVSFGACPWKHWDCSTGNQYIQQSAVWTFTVLLSTPNIAAWCWFCWAENN